MITLSELVFLIVFISTSSISVRWHVSQFPDMKTCFEAVEKSKAVVANSEEGADMFVAYCATDKPRW